MKTLVRLFLVLAILSSSIGCDQISKNMVRKNIDYGEQIVLIDNHFTMTKTENSGAFLGLGGSLTDSTRIFFLIILPLVALGLGVFYLIRNKNLSILRIFGISLIIGGGAGNIYDRIVHGSVTDFMHMNFVIFQTGIFNMADVSIMAGGFLIVLELFFKNKTNLIFCK